MQLAGGRARLGHGASVSICIGMLISSSASLHAQELGHSPANPTATEGLVAFKAGHFEEANEKLSRALDLADVPTISLYAARANAKLNHWVKAAELYHLAARLSPTSTADIKQLHAQYEAEREGAQLLARMPRLSIVIEGSALDVTEMTLDGALVPAGLFGVSQLVDPGSHELHATRSGQPLTIRFEIHEREQKVATIPLPANAPPPVRDVTEPPTPTATDVTSSAVNREYDERLGLDDDGSANPKAQKVPLTAPNRAEPQDALRSVGWAAVGVGSTGILLGATTGFLALRKRNSIDPSCSNGVCPMSARSDVDDYNSLRNWSSAGFIAGSIIAASGVGILLIGTGPNSNESPQLNVGPANVSVRGSF